ncbi:MBL fold metallo-hydrolase RNA specificity domain-containing protein [Tessaracoccus sp. OH4464_COT-324]|uniref:MBL fold metallo-hydrolase RNA specificity domain-containing protein n=1 Tax=Tessaracoccus sp. OH4464_COT-324 TaxID=2491059 RepID=UPI001F47B7DE|nr:MBL fold metallo-hydrolase [Tessaracoccus sp. OH4464_COT-324]
MSNEPVTLQFLGAAGTVTGSKYLLEQGEYRLLVDAGLYQGEKQLRLLNWEQFPADTINSIVLTHAHADHVAYLPVLVAQGYSGPIWCTEGTARLTEIVLRDSAYLQEKATEDAIRGGYSKHVDPRPLYTTQDAEQAIRLLRWVDYDTNLDLDGVAWARWTRAGHIVGSASVRIDIGETSVLFSGDLGRDNPTLLRPRETPEGAQWVVCESTYGDREHEEPAVPHEPLAEAINRTIARDGTVLIPAFAIDRTQQVMYELGRMQRDGRIPDVPVVVDGPMSMRALDVYRAMPEEFRSDLAISDFTNLKNFVEARGSRESHKALHSNEPRIVVSSSGMLEGGRVLAYLERLLPEERNTILICGYQATGTRGRRLLDGARHLKIRGRYVPVRAEIAQDRGFSAHADSSELLGWLGALRPRPEVVFLTHGEPHAAAALELRTETELGLDVVVPKLGEKVLLSERS